jgi:uncharacterized protein (TIGR02217 family)
MSIKNTVYPIGLSSLQKSIVYSTDITIGRSGHEVRNANWQDPLHKFNAASGIKTRADVATLEAFFHTCRGRETGFLLQDLSDYQIPSSGNTPQLLPGSGNTRQIVKRYTDALNNTLDRVITRPSSNTTHLKVYNNGSLLTHGSQYTYSATTGVITFTFTPSTVTITLDKFYVPVRFDTDELPIDLLCMWVDLENNGEPYSLGEMPSVPIVEIRE